jgi:hypothetical protein
MVSINSWLLYPLCPVSRRLCGPLSWCGQIGEENNLLPCQELSNSLTVRPGTTLTMLSLLPQYHKSERKIQINVCCTTLLC